MTIALAAALTNRVAVYFTINYIYVSSGNPFTLSPSSSGISGAYRAGSTDLTVIVDSSIVLAPINYGTSGLQVTGFSAGDRITITNNTRIFGRGGDGGSASVGGNGYPAVLLENNVTFINNGTLLGGGGGGGGCSANSSVGGGGGAGGGNGAGASAGPGSSTFGGTGGNGSGSTGSGAGGGWASSASVANGQTLATGATTTLYTTANGGNGGGAGGGKVISVSGISAFTGSGQIANTAGGNAGVNSIGSGSSGYMCGGGGGWGAAGGTAYASSGTAYAGGAAGKAIDPNGYVLAFTNNGTVYGATS